MSAITVEEFVNKISYKVDIESLKGVLRLTDQLYTRLTKGVANASRDMEMNWKLAIKAMADSSRRSATDMAADAKRVNDAWGAAGKGRRPTAPGVPGATPGAEKGMGAGGMAMALPGWLKLAAVGYAAKSVGTYAIKSAADLENMTTQFKVMLGSADKANAMVANIQKLAASTPLTSMGITESARMLMQFGVAADKVIPTVRMLGDVAGGNQERLNRLAYALGQTTSRGKLTGSELMQYTEAGFNPLKIMEKNAEKFGLKAGISAEELSKKVSKGAISAEMVAKAFDIATSKGGQFYRSMAEGAQTLSGLYSTLVDNAQMSLVKAMQPVIPLLKQFIDWLGKIDWTPVVGGIVAVVEGIKLFGRTLVDAGIFDSLELIKIAIVDMFGDGGASEWATVIRAAANMVADAFWWVSHMVALVSATIQTLQENIVILAPFVMTLGTKMATSMLVALGPIGAVVAALGVVYYAYQRINDAREQGAREEKYHAAMVEEAAASSEHATYKLERAKLVAQNRMYDQMGNPNDAGRARRNATIAKFDEMIAASSGRRDAANAKLVEASGIMPTAAPTADPFGALLQQQVNASKKVTITQNNNIQMPVTVDDKGNTQLTPGAVNSLVDTKLRAVLNVKFLGVLAQGI